MDSRDISHLLGDLSAEAKQVKSKLAQVSSESGKDGERRQMSLTAKRDMASEAVRTLIWINKQLEPVLGMDADALVNYLDKEGPMPLLVANDAISDLCEILKMHRSFLAAGQDAGRQRDIDKILRVFDPRAERFLKIKASLLALKDTFKYGKSRGVADLCRAVSKGR